MKSCFFTRVVIIASVLFPLLARGDLTIVQTIDGSAEAGQVTIKIKGEMMRADVGAHVATIFDGKSGEVITLMNDGKTAVRMSADKIKAAAAMMKRFTSEAANNETRKFTPNGQKEIIDGYETEQYVYDGPDLKTSCWLAKKYPKADEILGQLRAIKSDAWDAAKLSLPDVRELPGIPLRTQTIFKKGLAVTESGKEITTTIRSIKLDPVNEAEFVVPKDFKEMQMPDLFGGKGLQPSNSGRP